MYAVSQEYKKAMKDRVQHFQITGTIKTGSSTYEFLTEDILKGSMNLTNQCCGNDEIQIGSVYAAELKFTFSKEVARYSLKDALVTLEFGQKLPSGQYETVPLGIFEISEANHTRSGIDITAYDLMGRFEKNFTETLTNGVPYDLLLLACKQCKVELGMTRIEVEVLPNGVESLGIYPENDIETYRDFISYISQVLAGFCIIDRYGKLKIINYGDNPIDEVDTQHRWEGCGFSDFITRYTGLSVTNMVDQTTKYYNVTPDDGLTMNMGNNPLLQFGLDETKERIANNILAALQKVNYVPFEAEMIGNPAYDLGDVLRFTGGYADGSKLFCMTKYNFDYNATYTIQGVGKNSRLADGRSKVDKNLSGLLNQISAKDIIFYSFINASRYQISNNKTNIISIDFVGIADSTAEFKASILLKSTIAQPASSTVVKATYEINNSVIENYYPTETYMDGSHNFFLYYPITKVEGGKVSRLNVFLESAGGNVTIEQGQILANVSGQGLAAKITEWDGKIENTEEFPSVTLGGLDVRAFADSVETALYTPQSRMLDDEVEPVLLGGLAVATFEEAILQRVVVMKNTIDITDKARMTFNSYYVDTAENYKLQKQYTFTSVEQEIDTGRMCVVDIDSGQFVSVEGIEVE